MKRILFTLMIALSCAGLCRCSSAPAPGPPVEQPTFILKNYDNFFQYVSKHMKLSQDIVTYNAAGKPISKGDFLKVLTTGYYLPLRLLSTDPRWHFKLYRMSEANAKEMGQYIKGWTEVLYEHYLREGRPFGAFDLTDLKGNRYNAATTKGKTVIMNCWFIGCSNCEKEMPALNTIVAQYKGRKDIVFVAPAPDSKAKLQVFLKRKQFDYAIIPDQHAYLANTLKVDGYPTHFVINSKGIVVACVDTPEELLYALDNRLSPPTSK